MLCNDKNFDTKYHLELKFNNLKSYLVQNKITFCENEKLANHTSVKVGGKARIFVYAKGIKRLANLLNYLCENEIEYQILGNGTNVLAGDKTFQGVVICTKKLKRMWKQDNGVYVQCGLGLFEFCHKLKKFGYGGLEFMYGIPGTVGGAVVMNAGAFGGSIGDFVQYVYAYQNGKIKKISKNKLGFSYRESIFQKNNMIVLGVKFILPKDSGETISQKQNEFFQRKLTLQPYDYPSFGSAFKKCEGIAISKLIDDLGLKGYTIGRAQISKKHAGFIINIGGATCKDYLKMIKYIQTRVKDAYGIMPEPEVKLLE